MANSEGVRWLWRVSIAAAVAFYLVSKGAALSFPQLTGRVVDEADIIPPATEVAIEQKLSSLEAQTTNQFVVVTLKSLQGYEIADYGYQLGRAWKIGQKHEDNGVLLIVAPNERDVRFEVGYGLEGDLTDAVSRLIIENAILPKFREGDMPGGIVAGVDDVIKVLSGDADTYKRQAERQPKSYEATRPDGGSTSLVLPLLIIVILVIIFSQRSRRRRASPWTWVPGDFGSDGWSGGSSSGGWLSGSGGFSGGGGSFGGGGASGRW